jgi:hypothetical protein
MLFKEYICATKEQTLNPGIIKTYNQRWSKQIDDLKDFLVMHYQGGRTDTEFWKYITSGATQTDSVKTLMDMARVRTLSYNDFPRYWGVAGWSLYSWVMAGLGLFDNLPANDNPEWLFDQEISYLELQQRMAQLYGNNLTHAEYINFIQSKR